MIDRFRLSHILKVVSLGIGLTVAAGTPVSADQRASPETQRLAIVVGNSGYIHAAPLSNAVRDAQDVAEMLRRFGFSVFDGYDVDRQGFEALLRQAMLNAREGTELVFFFAGHGIQIGRRNYLLPVDVRFNSVYDLPTHSITLDRVIETLAAVGSVHVAIIDACRENPFPDLRLAGDLDATLFETRAGFDVMRAPLNSLVAFSTSPGAIAFDGEEGRNSPYTEAVLTTATARPDESVHYLFAAVRERVYSKTGGRQVPWESSTLVRPFRFQTPDSLGMIAAAQTDATSDGSARASSATPRGVQISLSLMLDRSVALSEVLAEASGVEIIDPVVLTPPAKGQLRLEDGGKRVTYAPELSEVRAAELSSWEMQGNRVWL